jgi:hypothetical protein
VTAGLASYLKRPLDAPDPAVLAAIAAGPVDPSAALPRSEIERMRDPAPLAVETGWCTLASGVVFVAVRTAMPNVTAEMVDWWFDWHPEDPLRYRVWHPLAHRSNSVERPAVAGVKRHWDTVHHPVEDVGIGIVRARIAFRRPSELGFADDAHEDPRVGTIVCGLVGDERRRMRHTVMSHVFLNEDHGVVLRSAFWLGSAIRPYGPLGGVGERLLNNRLVRAVTLPAGLPQALATHCAEEYSNLGGLLPELHARYGPQG